MQAQTTDIDQVCKVSGVRLTIHILNTTLITIINLITTLTQLSMRLTEEGSKQPTMDRFKRLMTNTLTRPKTHTTLATILTIQATITHIRAIHTTPTTTTTYTDTPTLHLSEESNKLLSTLLPTSERTSTA